MVLAGCPEAREPGVGQASLATRGRGLDRERRVPPRELPRREVGETDPATPGPGTREASLGDLGGEIDGLEKRAADVGGGRADPHPRQGLAQPGFERREDVIDRTLHGQVLGTARSGRLGRDPDREPRVHRAGTARDRHRRGVDVEDVGRLDDQVGPAPQARRGEGCVHGTRREDGWHREPAIRHPAIGEHDGLGTVGGGPDGRIGHPVERRLEPVLPRGGGPGRVDGHHAPATLRPKRMHERLDRREDRARAADQGAAPGQAAEERFAPADVHPQVHDEALALGVDRRVGHLREGLLEEIGGATVHPPEARGGRVVAHRPQRLMSLERHGPDVEAQTLGVEPGEEAERRGWVRRAELVDSRRRGSVERRVGTIAAERACEPRPRRRIGMDASPRRLHKQHFARSEAAETSDLGPLDRNRTRFRRRHYEAFAGHRIRERAKAVAIEHRAHRGPVGEHERRRAVPRGQEAGRPAQERHGRRGAARVERRSLGDQRAQGGRQAPPGRHQQLHHVVERFGIGAIGREQRTTLGDRGEQSEPVVIGSPAEDLEPVAAHRVDLAVVRDQPERLGEAPGRVGIGGEPLVKGRVGERHRLAQVGIQVGEAIPRHEALVDERPAGAGCDGQFEAPVARLDPGGPHDAGDASPDQQELTLEGRIADQPTVRPVWPADEHLVRIRARGRGGRTERCRIHRHTPPAGGMQADLLEGRADDRLGPPAARRRSRHEQLENRGPVAQRGGSARATCGLGPEEGIEEGGLQGQGDPGPVGRCAVGAERAAVPECGETGERQRKDPIRRAPAGIGRETDPARVVLARRVVERRRSDPTRGHRSIRPGRRLRRGRRCRGPAPPRSPAPGCRGRGRRSSR